MCKNVQPHKIKKNKMNNIIGILLYCINAIVIVGFSLYLGRTTLYSNPFSIYIERKLLALSFFIFAIALTCAMRINHITTNVFIHSIEGRILMVVAATTFVYNLVGNFFKKEKRN